MARRQRSTVPVELKDMTARDPNATPASMVVVEHWFDELRQRVPAAGK
jgi:hypothetical protein